MFRPEEQSEFGILETTPVLNWYAIRVRSRQEFSVAQQMEGKGYEYLLPTTMKRKRWSDRIREVAEPLFPGYLFCRFNPERRLPILTTPSVIQIVGYDRQPISVDESEIAALKTMMASGAANQPWPYLEVGDKVRIESGPLRGLEGILVDTRCSHRLVLSVSLLQRSVAVEIDSAVVSRVEEGSRNRRSVPRASEMSYSSR